MLKDLIAYDQVKAVIRKTERLYVLVTQTVDICPTEVFAQVLAANDLH